MTMQWFVDSRIQKKILSVLSIPIALGAVVGVIAIVALFYVYHNVRWVNHTHVALAKGDAIVAAAVDMETGMRGFLLAGDESFLEPYRSGEQRIFAGLAELRQTVSDNPGQVARLQSAEQIIQEWQSEVVDAQIALRRDIGDADTMNDVARIVGEARGKAYFDAFREQIATFVARERELLDDKTRHFNNALLFGATTAQSAEAAMKSVTHTYGVIAKTKEMLAAAVDMETGMRGYLLAGQVAFLEPYENGRQVFDALLSELLTTVSDNPEQVQLLNEMQTTIATWRTDVVQPMIELRTSIGNAKTMDDMADLIGEARGKTYFDGFRAEMAEFHAEEAALLEIRSSRLQTAKYLAIGLIGFFLAIAVGFGVLVARKAGASIAQPIQNIIGAMQSIIDGQQEVAIDGQQRKDEVGELARATQVFQENAEKVVKLAEADAENARKLEEAAKIAADQAAVAAEKEKQDRAAAAERNKMVDKLQSEIKLVVDQAVAGDFSQRASTDFSERELAALAENVNTLVESVDHGLEVTGVALRRVADGDLTQLMQGEFTGAFKDLQDTTNDMIQSLEALIGDISDSTVNLASSSGELRDTSDALSKQAEQNAASLEETSAALEELTASIKQVSGNVTEANNSASIASDTAKSSSIVAADAADAMSHISEASKEIAKVVTVINDIAFQINLLALNAGVEAARAGEAGRGFSVVASEVRLLAQRAGEAATEIDAVIARSDHAVTEGVAKVSDAQESLERISESVVGISQHIGDISSAISEQVNGIGEINAAVSQIDSNTQKQAASFEEVTATGALLSNEAEGLKRSTARFKTNETPSGLSVVEENEESVPEDTALKPAASVPTESGNLARDLSGWDEF